MRFLQNYNLTDFTLNICRCKSEIHMQVMQPPRGDHGPSPPTPEKPPDPPRLPVREQWARRP